MHHIYYPNNAVILMERSRNSRYFYDTDINCNMAMVLLNIIISMISIIERENTQYIASIFWCYAYHHMK